MRNFSKQRQQVTTAVSVLLVGGLLMQQTLLPALVFASRTAPQIEASEPAADEAPAMTPVESLAPPPVTPSDLGSPDHSSSSTNMPSGATVDNSGGSPVLKVRVGVEQEFKPDVVFEDKQTLNKGEKLILTMMDTVATGYSQDGDDFSARVKEQVERNGKVLIPKGSLVQGHITEVKDPGHMDKQGHLTLTFDYILMPDGRKVPFQSQYYKGDTAAKATGRAVVCGIGGTVMGAVQGVLVGLQFGGLAGAVLTHGLSVAAGSGLGALGGLSSGLSKVGDHVILKEGDQIEVALQSSLQLPSVTVKPDTQNEIHSPDLTVKVTGYQLGEDPFKVANQINLTLDIDNRSSYTFGSLDVVLMDEYNQIYQISPFGNEDMFIFQLNPRSQMTGQFTFSVQSPELKHYLVFYRPYTREILTKISLSEAMKHLATTTQPASKHRERVSRSALRDEQM